MGVNTVLYKMLSLVQEMRSELNTTQFHTMFPTAAQLLCVAAQILGNCHIQLLPFTFKAALVSSEKLGLRNLT